jgi:tetratricopeptide (TPR) repeat protein
LRAFEQVVVPIERGVVVVKLRIRTKIDIADLALHAGVTSQCDQQMLPTARRFAPRLRLEAHVILQRTALKNVIPSGDAEHRYSDVGVVLLNGPAAPIVVVSRVRHPIEIIRRQGSRARQAVRIEPDLGEGYASLAHVRLHDWDWVGIESGFRRAEELDPGYAIAHYWYAEYLMAMGRTEEAIRRVEHSLVLDPLNSVINASVGMIRYLAHDYDGALVALRRGLEIDPTHYVSHLRVGLVCLQKNLPNEAVAAMLQAVTHSRGSTEAKVGLAQAYAIMGDSQSMKRIVQKLGEGRQPYVSPYNVARLYGAIDDKPRALEWLERAYEEHNPDLIELTREPSFSSLRSDAKFRELAVRVGWSSVPAAF